MGQQCCKEEEEDLSGEVHLLHFNLLRSVGKGAFGKVRVVQHKTSNEIYALKYINKAQCIKMRAVDNIIQERRLLEEISCLFVCNLRYAFQDDENMFMVIDLMLGGDLRFHLDRQGQMKEEQVKFYIAELSYGLSILHSRKIVHRDLKPDNVLLDDVGHAHLTDFNIAVHFREEKPLTAVAGSMAYMAPEILARKGYLSTIDWWSLGVMMYELIFGNRPFRAKTNDALTNSILNDEVYIPSQALNICSQECIDCINAYLTRDITKRLGVKEMGGYNGIRNHPFFKDVNWDDLEQKKVDPPFIPDAKRANFDATHELEELLLEDNPLKNKSKQSEDSAPKAKPVKYSDDPAVQKALKTMQEKFTVYDFTKHNNPVDHAALFGSEPSGLADGGNSSDPALAGRTESSMISLTRDIMDGRDNEVNMIGVSASVSGVTGSVSGNISLRGPIRTNPGNTQDYGQALPNTEE